MQSGLGLELQTCAPSPRRPTLAGAMSTPSLAAVGPNATSRPSGVPATLSITSGMILALLWSALRRAGEQQAAGGRPGGERSSQAQPGGRGSSGGWLHLLCASPNTSQYSLEAFLTLRGRPRHWYCRSPATHMPALSAHPMSAEAAKALDPSRARESRPSERRVGKAAGGRVLAMRGACAKSKFRL